MASIKKRPNGKWRGRYRDADGKEHARHFHRKVDAEHWLGTVNADVLLGRYVDPSAGKITFKTYAERWRKMQPHRPQTADMYEKLFRLHIYPLIGETPLSSVRRSDVQSLVAHVGQNLAASTTRKAFAITRTVFLAAVEDRLIAESPCRRIALPELDDGKVIPLTVEQVRQIVDAAPDDLRALVVLAAATGLRSGELLGLTVDKVDFLRRTVTVDQQLVYIAGREPFLSVPKTKASHRPVPVPGFALDELAAHIERHAPESPDGDSSPLLFQRRSGGPILRTTLNGRWRRVVKRAGLPSTPFHHLRHHYASVLISGGESVKVVQERLGHASAVETLKTYSHLFPDDDDRTRQVVERAWQPAETVAAKEA